VDRNSETGRLRSGPCYGFEGTDGTGLGTGDHLVAVLPEEMRAGVTRPHRYTITHAGGGNDLVELHSDADIAFGEGGDDVLVGSGGWVAAEEEGVFSEDAQSVGRLQPVAHGHRGTAIQS
jgi:hypothetical protein